MSITRILLTGANGFVGCQLLEKLDQNEVVIVGRTPIQQHNQSFFQIELNGNSNYKSALDKINVVIHCAARVHIMSDSSSDPLCEFRTVNTDGTLNLARQAAEAGVKRFIFLSSIKVNGETTSNSVPFTPFDQRLPKDPYGVSKAEAEEQLLALGKETGMDIVIIRPPLVYGEGVKANFASLMRFVGKGYPMPFRSIKDNKRSLVSVYNLVDLIKVCIDHPNAANEIFLASDDNDLSTAEIIALMAKVQNKKNFALPLPVWCFKLAGKLFGKQDIVDRLVGSLQLDITHTKNTLDWKPPYTVEHGFKLAVKNSYNNN